MKIKDKKMLVVRSTAPVEIVDYMDQPLEAREFADRVENECSINRRRLGYRGFFNTNGDAILTAYLAGYRAGHATSER